MSAKSLALAATVGVLSFTVGSVGIAADRSYKEGNVTYLSAIRTQPGMFEEYLKYLAGPYKQLMEEQKKAGLIVDYAVFAALPRQPQDPDLYLTVTYKNMAALDDLAAKTDAMVEKIYGSLDQQSAADVKRGELRTLLGDELIRELVLK